MNETAIFSKKTPKKSHELLLSYILGDILLAKALLILFVVRNNS